MHVSSLEDIQILEAKIGYTFKKKEFIEEAVTHKSFAKEKSGSPEFFNERLEFLGDAVLELIVCEYLFKTYPQYTEAELSKIKSYAVQEATLSDVSSMLGIGSHLRLGKGEESSGGREKPSLLANAFEAITAAIYLDGGLKDAKDFVINSLENKIRTLIEKKLIFDFKTQLQELVQEKFGVLPRYKVHKEEGPEHMKTFEVEVFVKDEFLGRGMGKNKKEAAQRAAEEGLKRLQD